MGAAAGRSVTRAGGKLARERLAAYSRYAQIVAEQEEALAQGDLETFEALGKTATELQAELDGSRTTPDLSHDPDAGSDWFVSGVTDLLRATLARNERITARLSGLRRDAAQAVRAAAREAPRLRSYVERSGREAGETHLDLKF